METIPGAAVREGDILQGKYRVERVLGVGGMGFVVAAHHLQLDQKVAIKSLLPQGLAHAEVLRRFELEARTAVKIKSEHVARVLDVARFDDGTPYLVMEHLDGHDLSKWLATRGRLSMEQAVEFVVQACDAIAEAHSLGIVHRDLKPSNLFVVKGRDGLLMTKVIDFGISKSDELSNNGARMGMTSTRAVLGSPEYMSPEQFSSPKTVDSRTDIWALGVTLFELLSGRAPFSGDDLITIGLKITQEAAPLSMLSHAGVPAGLASVIRRCLEKDRGARYQDVAELALALAPFAPQRAHALTQRIARIARIVHEGRASSFAATAFAQPLAIHPIPELAKTAHQTQQATSWPTAHPHAAGPATTTPSARQTHQATSWPTAHPAAAAAREPTSTASGMTPLVTSIPAPPTTIPRDRDRDRRLVTALGLAAVAAVGVVVMIGACTSIFLRNASASSTAAPSDPTQESRTEASSNAPALSSSSPPVVVTPAPELSSDPPQPKASASSASADGNNTFRGTHEVSRVTWRFGSEVYRAVIHTNGPTGYADVSFIEPGHGPVVVRENLTLQKSSRGGWSYVGSNARYADDGTPANFIPNVFYMTEGGKSGSWTFVETCVIGVGACTRLTSGSG